LVDPVRQATAEPNGEGALTERVGAAPGTLGKSLGSGGAAVTMSAARMAINKVNTVALRRGRWNFIAVLPGGRVRTSMMHSNARRKF
jgi:hypothetical protein